MNAHLIGKVAGWAGAGRLALLAWGGAGSMFLLLLIEHALGVLHPASVLFLFLATLTLVTPIVAVLLELRRWISANRRPRSRVWTALAFGPLALCAAWGGYAYQRNGNRDVPKNLPMQLIVLAAASVIEARLEILSPHRIETQRLVMFYDDRVKDPRGDAAAMDRHVARMQDLTGLQLRNKIFYVRAPLFDDRHMSFLGLAFGSSDSPSGYVDLHELAHAMIGQSQTNESDPPTLLTEGWAESQSHTRQALSAHALEQRDRVWQWARSWAGLSPQEQKDYRRTLADPDYYLHFVELAVAHRGAVPSWIDELTSPRWYHQDSGAVYPIGGAFSDYLIRHYGAGKFVQLYFAARPGTFDSQCMQIFGRDVHLLESDFWLEQEQLVKTVNKLGAALAVTRPRDVLGTTRAQHHFSRVRANQPEECMIIRAMTAADWRQFYARERNNLGEFGLLELLRQAPAIAFPKRGALIFPHTRLAISGRQVAAVARSLVQDGYETVLAIGVLHGARREDAALVCAARAGDFAALNVLKRIHGPSATGDELRWTEEFSLDSFQILLSLAARAAGTPPVRLIACYPLLTGEDPQSLPGFDELASIIRGGAAVVATADMIHHGAGYGTPSDRQLPIDDPKTVATARAWILEGLGRLAKRDFAGFLKHAQAVRSDFRDGGPILAALLERPFEAVIEDLVLVDYSDVLGAPQPTWVAAALVKLIT